MPDEPGNDLEPLLARMRRQRDVKGMCGLTPGQLDLLLSYIEHLEAALTAKFPEISG